MTPDTTNTGLKARSRRAAAYVRESRVRTSLFVIAMFLIATYQDRLVDWKPGYAFEEGALFGERHPSAFPTFRELFTWDGVVAGFDVLVTWVSVLVGPWTLTTLMSYVTCLLAIAWLHSASWKQTLVRLGLPRPARVEFTVPLIACIPGVVFTFFTLNPPFPVHGAAGSKLLGSSDSTLLLSSLASSFSVVVTLGLLYRGLVENANWSRIQAFCLLACLPNLLSLLETTWETWEHFPGGFPTMFLANLVWTGASIWLFEQWQRRLWCLVVLAIGTSSTTDYVLLQGAYEPDFPFFMLRLASLLFLTLWTLWQTKSINPRKLAQPA